jgi:hypothetical protein
MTYDCLPSGFESTICCLTSFDEAQMQQWPAFLVRDYNSEYLETFLKMSILRLFFVYKLIF